MNLRNIAGSLQDDGFAIEDPQSIVSAETPLRVRYELSGGWVTRDIAFEVTYHPTLFHPFRKRSMFVYTGEKPTRVIVQQVPDSSTGQWGAAMARRDFDGRSFYPIQNFQAFPDLEEPIWQGDDYLPASFGVVFEDTTLDRQFISEGVAACTLEIGCGGSSGETPIPAGAKEPADAPGADESADDDSSLNEESGEPNAY